MFKKVGNLSKGFLDIEIDPGTDVVAEINQMRKDKNAIILAHYYQTGDIQDIADFVGDSLALSREAEKQKPKLFCLRVCILWQKQPNFLLLIKRFFFRI